jgi:hypothetical protein
MKQLQFAFFAFLLLAMCYGCTTSNKVDLSSPEATFQTMVNAIDAQDIDSYAQCWHETRANNDGMVLLLKTEPQLWNGLKTMFHTDSKLIDRSEGELDGYKVAQFEVITPGIENGDRISSVALTEVNGEWKMYHW